MVRKCSEKGKTRRKTITRVKKRHADKEKELEAKHEKDTLLCNINNE